MYGKISVNLFDIVLSLTELTDLIDTALSNHHKRVAYTAYRICDQLGYSLSEKREILLAGLLHDIGAFSIHERRSLLAIDGGADPLSHAFKGCRLLSGFSLLNTPAHIIKFHHLKWDNGNGAYYDGEKVDERSHILHLADRVAIMVKGNEDILLQAKYINNEIPKMKGHMFKSEHVDAFLKISKQEKLWLDLVYEPIHAIISPVFSDEMILTLDQQTQIAKIIANIIDFRSPYTANHSRGVAACAEHLASLMNFSPMECRMMLIAGYLHDLGKIAVPSEILEKPSKLDVDEFSIMRSHTYYTYRVLNKIRALQHITEWAAFHHERLDGTGYPFRLKEDELSLGSRIMAVVDVFTAISEDRPYRNGMEKAKVINILKNMVKTSALCGNVTSVMLENFDDINNTRIEAQRDSQSDYENLIN